MDKEGVNTAVDAVKAASGDLKAQAKTAKKVLRGCLLALVFVFVCMGILLIRLASPDSGAAKDAASSDSCGVVSTVAHPPKLSSASCDFTSKTPSPNGFYFNTFFGCSGGGTDPSDNCIPACKMLDSVTKTSGKVTLDKSSGPAYENGVEYFAANADEYGCNNTLKVTNPTTGKGVIVKVIERGPSCSVQTEGAKVDLSKVAQKALDGARIVAVEKVADDTPLGPIDVCSADTTTVGGSSGGNLANADALTVDQIKTVLSGLGRQGRKMLPYAQQIYNSAQKFNVNPLFSLAMFMHESSFGTAGAGKTCRNPGNIGHRSDDYSKSGITGLGNCNSAYGGNSRWEGFNTLGDGAQAQMWLIRTNYMDKGLTTPEKIIAKYAPSSDGNNETAYVKFIKEFMTEHAGGK